MEQLMKYLDQTGLSQLWTLIVAAFVAQETGKGLSTEDFTTELKAKLDSIAENAQVNVIESVSVNGVALEVTEKGVNIAVPTGTLASLNEVGVGNLTAELKTLIEGKASAATTLEGYGITDAYTKEAADAAIKTAVDAAVSNIYKVKGSKAFADLPTEGMAVGDVYNISDDFITTDAFVEGAGYEHKAGTNVAYTENGWDCMAGTYDFSDFVMASDIQALTAEEIAAICVMPAV